MKLGKRIAAFIGVVCGAELVVAVTIGGAGLGAAVGWDGLVVALIAIALAVGVVVPRRRTDREESGQSLSSGSPMAPDATSASISSTP